jgi:hypothetical protein
MAEKITQPRQKNTGIIKLCYICHAPRCVVTFRLFDGQMNQRSEDSLCEKHFDQLRVWFTAARQSQQMQEAQAA